MDTNDFEHKRNAQWHLSINADAYDEASLCTCRECEFLEQFQTNVRYPYCVVARFKDENIIADVVTHTHSTVIDGAVYNYKKDILLYYPAGLSNKTLRVFKGCKVITEDAFRADCYFDYNSQGDAEIHNKIEDIYLPSSLVSIHGNPFVNCPNLKQIFIREACLSKMKQMLDSSLHDKIRIIKDDKHNHSFEKDGGYVSYETFDF